VVRNASHQPIERIDFTDQTAFAKATDGRIAAHLANGREAMGDQRRRHAQARRGRRRLATGMAAADNNDSIVSHRNFPERRWGSTPA